MTPRRPGSAITAMWAWDNPVEPALDPRGRGYAPATADRLAAFAHAGGLREVVLPVPSAPARGPVDDWLRETVAALHDAGVTVTAVAGTREATAGWTTATTALAPFDRLQVAVVPWSAPGPGRTPADVGRDVSESLAAVRAAGTAVPVDACVPWWFATEAGDDGRTLLEPVLGEVDRVALAAPAAHAAGPGGVLELAAPAIEALAAAGRAFTVGVRTDAPDLAGGADRTFFDAGPVALIRECAVVGALLADVPGFEGVAVDGHREWRRLLGV